MIDIEKIADSIRPKETVYKLIPDSDPNKILKGPIFRDRPYFKELFQARDIKDLNKRKEYLLSVMERENEKDKTPQYVKPPEIIINGRTITGPGGSLSEKIRLISNKALISQCEAEIKQVNDLMKIVLIIQQYSVLGENEGLYFLHYAKEGQVNNEYTPPQYYSNQEFAQIIETAAAQARDSRQDSLSPSLIDPKQTGIPTRAIALYSYYLALCDGSPVTRNNCEAIAAKFGKNSPNSGIDLYNQFRKILRDKMERVGISRSSNANNSRFDNLNIAIRLLRKDNNLQAIKIALSELEELQNAYDKKR